MRFALPLSGVLLAALPTLASAQGYVAEAPVVFGFIASHTGEGQVVDTSTGGTVERSTRSFFRVGMRELLNHLIEREVIPTATGWRIIAVWADWPDTGSGYRFYVQNFRDREARAIPEDVLHFEVLDSATARKHTLSGDTIIGGSESYTSYAQLKVSLAAGTGTVNGLATSIDLYRRPPGFEAAVYVPGPTRFRGTGVWDDNRPDQPDGLLEGNFGVGGMRIMPDTPYQTDLAASDTGGTSRTGATVVISAGNAQLIDSTVGQAIDRGTLALPPAGGAITLTPPTPPVTTDTTLNGSTISGFDLSGTVTLTTGITLQPSDLTVLSGASLNFSGGTLTLLDLTAEPTGNFSANGTFVTDGTLLMDGAFITAP